MLQPARCDACSAVVRKDPVTGKLYDLALGWKVAGEHVCRGDVVSKYAGEDGG